MNYNNNDIIIARSTPLGSSALAVIRLSGKNLQELVSVLIKNKTILPRYNYKIEFQGFKSNQLIDTCVMVYYKAPKSFTGEDVVEISCHGNNLIVESIINEFISKGVRIALPGEFSYRAFQNQKIDLIQAESIMSKISYNSAQYGVALQNVENGVMSKRLLNLKNTVLNTVSILEHELDFNEEEIEHLDIKKITEEFQKIKKEINIILKNSNQVTKIDKGYKVVILGCPNVGKSTLFNEIVGADKAIVTSIAGTTRDVLEAEVQIQNIPFTFYDTAGYRKTKDVVEVLGMQKSKKLVKNVDIVLILDDQNPNKVKEELVNTTFLNKRTEIICVHTKRDQLKKVSKMKNNMISVSVKNNLGVNELLTYLLTFINKKLEKNTSQNMVLCSKRQVRLLEVGKKKIDIILKDLQQGVTMDVIASECKGFVMVLEEMLGTVTSDEVLNNIFKGFCVGK